MRYSTNIVLPEAVMDLQLPMQSMPIKLTWVRILFRQGVLDTIRDKVCQWFVAGRWFSPVSFTNKTDHQDKTEILLKVALNTITLTPPLSYPLIMCIAMFLLVFRNFQKFLICNLT